MHAPFLALTRGEARWIGDQDRSIRRDDEIVRREEPTTGEIAHVPVRVDALDTGLDGPVRRRALRIQVALGEVDAAVLRHDEPAVARRLRRVGAATQLGDALDEAALDMDTLERGIGDAGADDGALRAPHRAFREADAGRDGLGSSRAHVLSD